MEESSLGVRSDQHFRNNPLLTRPPLANDHVIIIKSFNWSANIKIIKNYQPRDGRGFARERGYILHTNWIIANLFARCIWAALFIYYATLVVQKSDDAQPSPSHWKNCCLVRSRQMVVTCGGEWQWYWDTGGFRSDFSRRFRATTATHGGAKGKRIAVHARS